MGLITIACPSCKQLTEWFSGNPDQRCHRCKYEAKQSPIPGAKVDTSIFDGIRWHQLWPRPAVAGDIYPTAPHLYWHMMHLTFDDLALILLQTLNDPRTQEPEMSKAQTDIRRTSYNAATANAAGYVGTIDDAIAQIRAEPEEARAYWPLNISRERAELLDFLGVNRPLRLMSGIQQHATDVEVTKDLLARMARARVPEDDSVEYGVPEQPREPSRYGLEYARKRFPGNFAPETEAKQP